MLPNPTANPRQDRRNSAGLPHWPRSSSPSDDSTSALGSVELEEVEAVVSSVFPFPSNSKKTGSNINQEIETQTTLIQHENMKTKIWMELEDLILN